jgi:hypothetical protein
MNSLYMNMRIIFNLCMMLDPTIVERALAEKGE